MRKTRGARSNPARSRTPERLLWVVAKLAQITSAVAMAVRVAEGPGVGVENGAKPDSVSCIEVRPYTRNTRWPTHVARVVAPRSHHGYRPTFATRHDERGASIRRRISLENHVIGDTVEEWKGRTEGTQAVEGERLKLRFFIRSITTQSAHKTARTCWCDWLRG